MECAYAGPGVYGIRNLRSGLWYVGASLNVRERIQQHRSLLRNGKHRNRRLQAAWNEDGGAGFAVVVLEATGEVLQEAEQRWLDTLQSADLTHGYNDRRTAGKVSEAARQKISQAGMGKRHSEEARRNMSRGRLGMVFTEEHRRNIGQAQQGRKQRPETVEKRRLKIIGLPIPPQVREAAAQANAREFEVTSPAGEITRVHNLKAFCRANGLNEGLMYGVASPKTRNKAHRGWKCRRVTNANGLP